MEKIDKEKIDLKLSGKGKAFNAALNIFFAEGSLMDKELEVEIIVKMKKKDLYGSIRS